MKNGTLFYDADTKRMDICFEDGSTFGGLHCGTTFDVLIDGRWVPTRIEMSDQWYLIGVKQECSPGLRVRA